MHKLIVRLLLLPLGCFGGSPSAPPLPTPAPTMQSSAVAGEAEADRLRKRKAASNTLLTGSQGVQTQPVTERKTLLGS